MNIIPFRRSADLHGQFCRSRTRLLFDLQAWIEQGVTPQDIEAEITATASAMHQLTSLTLAKTETQS